LLIKNQRKGNLNLAWLMLVFFGNCAPAAHAVIMACANANPADIPGVYGYQVAGVSRCTKHFHILIAQGKYFIAVGSRYGVPINTGLI
jgi:hypothetical protein